jgi:GTPase
VTTPAHRTGQVAIVGRPNVGKSTLLNALIGVKLAAVTPKPQTTRTRIVGVRTLPGAQVIFVDTPGIHAARSALNRRMVDVAEQAIPEVDTVCLVLDAEAGVTAPDRGLIERLSARRAPIIVALNKIDRVKKPALLPQLAAVAALLPGRTLVPLSAKRGEGIPSLLEAVVRTLPEGPPQFGDDEFTTESSRFLVQEMVREQLFLALEQEVPYGTAVVVEEYREEPERGLAVVTATVLVERQAHKGMVIGAGGGRLKAVGRAARLALETLLGTRLYLELFVRVEPGWSRDRRRLDEIGL